VGRSRRGQKRVPHEFVHPVRHLLTDLVEALDGSYLDALARPDLTRFYPRLRVYQETGAKRGCIVLGHDDRTRERLAALDSLRPA
jgi:hypothetical protein